MSKITTTTNAKQGKLYAGPAPLPQGAKLIGTVTRDGYDTGALVELVNGRQVQYNAGVIRNLPGGTSYTAAMADMGMSRI